MPEVRRGETKPSRGRRIAVSLLILAIGLAPVELAIFLLVDGFWTQLLLVLAVAVPVAIGLGVWVRSADSHPGAEGDMQLR